MVESSINTNPGVISFFDASYGGEKPSAGEIEFFMGERAAGPISWVSYRLPITPLSSCEAEWIAATRATTSVKATRDILEFIGHRQNEPTFLFCDNKSAVMLSDGNMSSKRMKHVATRIAFLREHVEAGNITLFHISTVGQIADIFTKPLPASTFHNIRGFMLQ